MNPREWGRGDTRRIATSTFPAEVLALVDLRHGRRCIWCVQADRETPDTQKLTLEHLRPLSQGGDNHWSNLAWACEADNFGRGNRARPKSVPTWARGPRG